MGKRLMALAGEHGLEAAIGLGSGSAQAGAADLAGVDGVIDFSVKAQAAATARLCQAAGIPLVMGTTGLDDADNAALDAAAKTIGVLWAPNFSVGVTVISELVAEAAAMLGEDYDIELVESHHRHKVDAPSGTARRLAERVAAARGWDLDKVARYGREGLVGARGQRELGISVVRGGSVVGTHEVLYLGAGEEIAITHRATDRDIFARGALRAMRWLIGQAPGRYTMRQVLRSP